MEENEEGGLVELADRNVSVGLGQPSAQLMALVGDERSAARNALGTVISISGIESAEQGAAKAALEKVSDSVLFSFDSKFQQPLVLSRSQAIRFPFESAPEGGDLAFPESEFDREPMSLYWYGRGAEGLPLLEFFAYYQVLEFYFEQYVEADGRRRIAQVLRDPGFSAHNERHIVRVLRAAGRGGKGRRNEREQLLTTLRGCADVEAIRRYLDADEERRKFFEEKVPKLTDEVLQLDRSDGDLLKQIADRIYDIRCRIVHTKESGGDDGVELLLPDSPEADRLHRDIDLLRQIARQALVSNCRPLALASSAP